MTVGASSADEVKSWEIKVGDSVTIRKSFHNLLDRRVSVRSLDDRVGCAALIHAVWELGENSLEMSRLCGQRAKNWDC